jgi:hypothetical protein
MTCRSKSYACLGIRFAVFITSLPDRVAQCRLQHMRSSYRDALVQEMSDDLPVFSGCRVSLVDSGDPPYLPRVNSCPGHECVHLLAEHIRSVGIDIHTLESRKIRSRETKTVNPERSISLLVERFVPAGESVPFEFHWTGGGPSYRTDVPRGLLPAAVQSKIDKRYIKPASSKFWLLAYSVDTLFGKDDPDIAESQRLLEASRHPFDEAWFLYAYAEMDLGALVHVWPRNPSEEGFQEQPRENVRLGGTD